MDEFMFWLVGLFHGMNGADLLAIVLFIVGVWVVLTAASRGSRSTSRQPHRDQAHFTGFHR